MKWSGRFSLAVAAVTTLLITSATVAHASGLADWIDLLWWLSR